MTERSHLYGLLAEFRGPESLMEAAIQLRDEGYVDIEAFTPYPIEELPHAIGKPPTRLPWLILAGGVIGGAAGYALQVWVNLVAYPINVGGRPLHSWPSFIPPTFECTVLLASLTGLFGMLYLNGLPRLNHPLFAIDAFKRASTDGFFLCIEAEDERFELSQTGQRLTALGATEVWHVPLEG